MVVGVGLVVGVKLTNQLFSSFNKTSLPKRQTDRYCEASDLRMASKASAGLKNAFEELDRIFELENKFKSVLSELPNHYNRPWVTS